MMRERGIIRKQVQCWKLEDSQLVYQPGGTRQKRTETGVENEAKNKREKQNLGLLSGLQSCAVQHGGH